MPEHDPSAKNAVNPNFNKGISANGLTVVNMSATTSINSQYSEKSRNCVYLCAWTHTCTWNYSHFNYRRNPNKTNDGNFIKTFQDKDKEFPTTNPPPSTDNPLETTILVQTQTPASRPTHTYTTNHSTNNTTDTPEITILAQTRTQTKSAFCHLATKNYGATDIMKNKTNHFLIPHQFSNSKTSAPTSCSPFYFIPISEKAHKLRPTLIDSNKCRHSRQK